MPFTHSCGHVPLPGYTIKRGINSGGFGEVYFGLTDGGKEVALKRIIRHQDIELRGIRQCLNLKHPNLVHLYDLKTDDRGDPWLVMEYIRGETLHAVLRRHPNGLPHDLVRPWFSQLAAAVHSLHEQGIVHRDLKPGNVFLENGMVKVGDYGLCKFIGGSQHRSQTQHVGSIHYMAPEIGKGDYSRPIDVYAAGILLHEMVTGKVPFDGETTGEILFKHLSSAPDLTGAGVFAPIIARALSKRPEDRFPSLAEMARRVGETAPLAVPAASMVPAAAPYSTIATKTTTRPAESTVVLPAVRSVDHLGRRLAIAGGVCAAVCLMWATISLAGDWSRLLAAFAISVAASWGIVALSCRWTRPAEDSLARRAALAVLGAGLGVFAVWLEGYSFTTTDVLAAKTTPAVRVEFFGVLYPNNTTLSVLAGHVLYFGLLFATLRWWHLTEATRNSRISWPAMFATAFWAYVLLFLLPSGEERLTGFAAAVATAAAAQIASPRRDPDPVPSKKLRLHWA